MSEVVMVGQSDENNFLLYLSKDCLNLQVQSRKKEEQGQHKGKSSHG